MLKHESRSPATSITPSTSELESASESRELVNSFCRQGAPCAMDLLASTTPSPSLPLALPLGLRSAQVHGKKLTHTALRKVLRTCIESSDCQPRHAQHLAREFVSCLAAPAVSQQSPANPLEAPQVPGTEGRSSSKVSLFSSAAASPAARPHAANNKMKLSLELEKRRKLGRSRHYNFAALIEVDSQFVLFVISWQVARDGQQSLVLSLSC